MRWQPWEAVQTQESGAVGEKRHSREGSTPRTEGFPRKTWEQSSRDEQAQLLLITVSLEAKNYILIVKASLSQHSPTYYMESSQQLINKQKCTVSKSVKWFWVCIKAYHKIDSDYVWEHTATLRRHRRGWAKGQPRLHRVSEVSVGYTGSCFNLLSKK